MAEIDEFDATIIRVLDAVGTEPAGCTITRTTSAAHRRGDGETSSYTAKRVEFTLNFWSADTYVGGEVVCGETLEAVQKQALERVDQVKAWAKSRREQNAAMGV
jgi:hypothetical protein